MTPTRVAAAAAVAMLAFTSPAAHADTDDPLVCVHQGPITVGPVTTPDIKQCFL